MKDISRLESEEFETLLWWLSEDRELAGAEYNNIRAGLIRFFRLKGCSDAQTLADETFNRVAEKIPTFDESKNPKKSSIFLGFATNIAYEHLRNRKKQNDKLREHLTKSPNTGESDGEAEKRSKIQCLHLCLKEISEEDGKVFFEYYGQKKEKKSVARRQLAERLGCEINTLSVRVFRIKEVLAKCIGYCMKKSL